EMEPMVDTPQLVAGRRADLPRQILPVVLGARDHGPRPLRLGAKELGWCVDVDVPGVRGERVGHADEIVGEHGDQRWRRSKVGMKVTDGVATYQIGQVAS